MRATAVGADGWSGDPAVLTDMCLAPANAVPPIDPEALALDAIAIGDMAVVYDRLIDRFPRLKAMTGWQQLRTREDLVWIARFTGAAVLTGDATILDDFLGWLLAVLGDRVPAAVTQTSVLLVADGIEPIAPYGAEMLRESVERLPFTDGTTE